MDNLQKNQLACAVNEFISILEDTPENEDICIDSLEKIITMLGGDFGKAKDLAVSGRGQRIESYLIMLLILNL